MNDITGQGTRTAARPEEADGSRRGIFQGNGHGSASAPARTLTWAEAETMDILADGDMMEGIAEGREDVRAGRLVEWKPRSA